MIFEVPLSAKPQRFLITLANKQYQFRVWWNAFSSNWVLDIADAEGKAIVSGIPLVTGTNLLGQYGYLGIGGGLFVASNTGDVDDLPTFDNLGTDSKLYFYTS